MRDHGMIDLGGVPTLRDDPNSKPSTKDQIARDSGAPALYSDADLQTLEIQLEKVIKGWS